MKTKFLVTLIVFLLTSFSVQAQLIEKLKERAKEKGIKTSNEVKYDSTAYDPNLAMYDDDEPEELKLTSAGEFYNRDVVMVLYDQNGQLTQTSFFDKDVIAMRTEMVSDPKPVYHDSKGKIYAYDDDEGQYKSMDLLPSASMGFMVAGMTTQMYKLPQTPYFNALKALEDVGSGLNFIILEIAFIYEPKDFENNEFYRPSLVNCGGTSCTRFNYNDPEYKGSYIQFDSRGRLRELNIVSTNSAFKDNPAGKFVFSYKPCTVELPDAVEQSLVPGELNKVFDLNNALEPWKNNKKDKRIKKNDN